MRIHGVVAAAFMTAAAGLTSAPASAAVLASDLPSGSGITWSNKESLQTFLVRFTLAQDSLVNGFGIVNSNQSGGSETFPVRIRYAADVDGVPGPITAFADKLDTVTAYPAIGSRAVLSVAHFDPILFKAGTYWMGMSSQGDASWTWYGVTGGPSAPADQRQILKGELKPNAPMVYNLPFVVEGDVVASPTPEPATWALMIGGFGLAGAALRRRKTAVI